MSLPALQFEDISPKQLVIAAVVVLYIIGALFMRNTHPYSGNRREPFESKQRRRRIGVFFIAAATALLGITGLVTFMVSKS